VRKCVFVALAFAVLATLPACESSPTAPETAAGKPGMAATVITFSSVFPIAIDVLIPCANGGLGEIVSLSGNLHDLFHITIDGRGGGHFRVHDNPQGITGVGQTTGAKYQATGVTQSQTNFTVGSTDTFINNFRIIGQGPGNNFLVHENFHVTVNANGTVTVAHDNFSIECK
jgi:hypothetical protein